MVTYAGKISYPAAPDEDDGVLLKVMTDAGDIAGALEAVGKTDTGDFTKRGIRLLRGERADRRAYAAALGALLQNGGIGLILLYIYKKIPATT